MRNRKRLRTLGDDLLVGADHHRLYRRRADVDTDEEITYQIVGPYEADLKKNKISIQSPLGRALIGKTEGDTAEVTAPGGGKAYEVIKVKFK